MSAGRTHYPASPGGLPGGWTDPRHSECAQERIKRLEEIASDLATALETVIIEEQCEGPPIYPKCAEDPDLARNEWCGACYAAPALEAWRSVKGEA